MRGEHMDREPPDDGASRLDSSSPPYDPAVTNFSREFMRAVQTKVAWDFAQATTSRSAIHRRLHAEMVALANGEVERPTDFQQRVQAIVDENSRQIEALIEALGKPNERDGLNDAAGTLLAGLLGRTLSLEMRVEVLEMALDN